MKLGGELYQRAAGYWRGLAPRERVVLGAGIALAGVLLFFVLLWAPLQHDLNRLRADVPSEQQKLQWMLAQSNRINQLRAAAPTTVPSGGLASFVEQSARTYGIRTLIKPEGTNAVHLTLDGVAFNSFVEWLTNLQKQGGARVDNASLEPTPTPGVVNARVLLRAGGS
jgi:general secretion pathway protein M